MDLNGDFTYSHQIQVVVSGLLDVWSNEGMPKEFALEQNYPNPFNPSTVIRYQLADNSFVSLKVYNVLGEEVATLVNGVQEAGYHQVVWDSKNNNGVQVSTGIYTYRFSAGEYTKTQKMMVVK